jgi:type IX secretion system PorP/SprF family membrane protein
MIKFRLHSITGLLFMIFLFHAGFDAKAQQEPLFTQYYFNTQTYNPAYTGTWDNLGFMVLGRHQWIGMEGAPRTYTFSLQTPTKFDNVALGFNILSDRAGLEKRLMLNADYSYRLMINRNASLRLGIKAGVTSYSNNFAEYTGYPGDPADPAFMGEAEIRMMPNFGVGAYLSSREYYLGLSVPKLLKSDFRQNFNNYSTWAEIRHLFLTGGMVFELSDDVKLKPTFLSRFVWGAQPVVDLSANFLLRDKIWLGANWRTGDSFGMIAQWIFDNQLRIGYGVDFATNKLRTVHSGTHEVMVSYEIGIKRRWSSPRMF